MGVTLDAERCRMPLDYRPPYDWEGVRDFLALRAVPGVEHVEGGAYLRTVRCGDRVGWIRVTQGKQRKSLVLELSPSLASARRTVALRVRRLFDLDADPALIGARLRSDPRLARLVKLRPGLRVPRAFDVAEIGVRAILGQQVTVAAARTLAGRVARAFGEAIETPFAALDRLWPVTADLARSPLSALVAIPLTRARAAAVLHWMAGVVERKISFDDDGACTLPQDIEGTLSSMVELPGIGPWTANYIAMRGLGWSDAFPEGDLVLRQALGGATPRVCRAHAERWRPFRAYAVLHLWTNHTKG
jgi:AraC family transcriptional regulator of adaptative response / DNA-3-methyladenine glycosylase II